MDRLTPRQRDVLEAIRTFIATHGFAPTYAELAEELGFRSANAAAEHVKRLEKKGALTIAPGVARGLQLKKPAREGLPLVGRVAAGEPILADERVERIVPIAPEAFHPRADYFLRVRGDSMIEAGILPGDLVAVHRCPEVANGEIAVVRLDDEVTVKTWWRDPDGLRLEAANPSYAPRILTRDDRVAVEGKVVGLLRLGFGEKS